MKSGSNNGQRLCLLFEFGLADVASAQLDVKHPLHGGQDLLVGGGGAALEVGHDGGRGVALGREILLRQGLGLELGPGLRDGAADLLADCLGLDDVVRSVDFCQALAFYAGLGGLWGRVSGVVMVMVAGKGGRTRLPLVNFFSVPMTAPLR
jgi:hypothetical protein